MEQGRSTSLRHNKKGKDDKLIPRDISESLGKLPPQALDLEEGVLGALMLERNAMLMVADFLKPEHFYDDRNKEIYGAIVELFRNADPVDMRTVVDQLRKLGKIEIVGGAYYIAELTSKVSSAANIEYHARVVIEMAIKRSLITVASQIHHDAYEDTTDVFVLLDNVDKWIEDVHDGSISQQAEHHVKEIAIKSVENIQARQQGQKSGVASGFKPIDDFTHGWQNSDLIIIGARPGMGKTALVTQTCYNVANDKTDPKFPNGKPVALFSLEMPGIQVIDRTLIGLTEIDSDKIRSGQVSPLEMERWVTAAGNLSKCPWYIDDTPALSIIELRARCRRLKTKFDIQLIVVDYLQLINGMTRDNQNRDQEIGQITRTLKQIAKELEVPVIAISSLGRSVETRGGDKRPQLQDLRESGNIESDADVVVFLYRPEYYKISEDENGMPTHGKAEIIFAKHRNGALGTAVLKFLGRFTKFTTWEVEAAKVNYAAHYKDPTADADRGLFSDRKLIPMDEALRIAEERRNEIPPPSSDDTPF